MYPYHPFYGTALVLGALIALPTLAFLLLALFEGFPRLRIGQLAGMVGVAAWFFTLFTSPGPWQVERFFFWTAVGLCLTFCAAWKREVRHLMSRRDDEFPGRYDKLCWMALLTFLAPIGTWAFRSYRLRHRPGLGSAGRPAAAKPRSSPWDDEVDAHSPAGAGFE
jgi:hypothetical protein